MNNQMINRKIMITLIFATPIIVHNLNARDDTKVLNFVISTNRCLNIGLRLGLDYPNITEATTFAGLGKKSFNITSANVVSTNLPRHFEKTEEQNSKYCSSCVMKPHL